MSRWHVWGDFVHIVPDRIGNAKRVAGETRPAEATAKACGWDFDYRMRNGFEPWAETFESESDDGVEFAFKKHGNVRGWQRIG